MTRAGDPQEARLALERSSALLQAILESPQDMVIFALDRQYRYLAFNRNHAATMKRIWGVDIQVGQCMLDVIAREDDRERARANFDRALGGEAFTLVEEYGDERLSRRIYEDVYSPIRTADGEVIGLTLYLTDVTEQRLAQEELERYRQRLEALVEERTEDLQRANASLRSSEERYRSLVENAPVAIFVHRQGAFLYANPAARRLHGASHEGELVGKSVRDFLVPDATPPEVLAALESQAAELPTRRYGPFPIRRLDGEIRTLEVTTLTVDFEGEPARLVLCLDVTEKLRAEKEQRRVEERLRHTQKLESLGVLAGGIAHDFNNLLVAVLGNADLALEELSQESSARPLVAQIRRAALRAADLTQQLLAYSGRGRFQVQSLDLNALVREMVSLLRVSVSRRATLRFELSDSLPAVEADPTQLRQVVMNLITNASDAVGEGGGEVVLRTGLTWVEQPELRQAQAAEDAKPGFHVVLEVEDNGAGMDEETQSRIFDPFFTTKFSGRGLGLAAVLGIVRGHRGAIAVRSRAGSRTSFQVFLPVAATAAESSVERSAAFDPSWRGQGHVLVVDDEPQVRILARRILERHGFEVLVATDGRQCLELLGEWRDRIRLVLLDLTMPGLDGIGVLREIRREWPDLPVILCSGYSEEEVRRGAGRLRAAFLHKPFRLEDLLARVRDAAAKPCP